VNRGQTVDKSATLGFFYKKESHCGALRVMSFGNELPEKMVDCKRILGVMALSLKQGDTLTMTLDGEGEESLAQSLLAFMEAEL